MTAGEVAAIDDPTVATPNPAARDQRRRRGLQRPAPVTARGRSYRSRPTTWTPRRTTSTALVVAVGTALILIFCGAASAADGAGPGVDRERNPLAMASTAAVALSPGDDPAMVVVVNQTTAKRLVAVRLDVTDGAVTDIKFQASDSEPLPASGSLTIPITAIADAEPLDGFVVVTDAQSGQVIRQPFAVAAPTAVPAATSRDQSFALRPWPAPESRASLEPLPLRNAVCPRPAPSVMLTNGGDDARLTTTCDDGSLTMTVAGLDPWSVGDYTGTLVVGATEVSISLTKRASLWLFLLVVLAGIAIALILRSLVLRKPLEAARASVDKIGPAPNTPQTWPAGSEATTWLNTIQETARTEMLEPLAEATVWAARRPFKVFLAPSTAASQAVTDAEAKAKSAGAALTAWNQEAPAAFERLAAVDCPPALCKRALDLASGQASALREPEEPGETGTARSGIDGLGALLAEATAIHDLHTLKTRLDALEPLIECGPPTSGQTPMHRAVLHRAWVSARVEFDSLQALLARTFDARSALDDALLARVKHLAERTDQLATYQPPAADDPDSTKDPLDVHQQGRVKDLAERRLPQVTGVWQLLPGLAPAIAGIGAVLHRGGELVGEAMVVVLAVAIVVLASYSASYAGASWGTPSDLLVTFIGAAGGTVVLTPLISALDRLAGKDEGGGS